MFYSSLRKQKISHVLIYVDNWIATRRSACAIRHAIRLMPAYAKDDWQAHFMLTAQQNVATNSRQAHSVLTTQQNAATKGNWITT